MVGRYSMRNRGLLIVAGWALGLWLCMQPVCAQETENEPVQEETNGQMNTEETNEPLNTEEDVQPSEEPTEEAEPLNGWQEDHTKYYVDDVAVNGVYKIENDYYLFQEETFQDSFTGVVKNQDGQWVHLKNGKSDWNFTGFSKSISNGQWYISRNGNLDWSFTGVAKSIANDQWYHAKNGCLDWGFTGFSKSVQNGKWYVSYKGKLNWNYTGVAKSISNNQWYHAKNGCLDWNFTGLSKSYLTKKWYFSRNGKLDWNFTGVAKSIANGQWYYARKGAVDWSYTGLSKSVANQNLYYVEKGRLNWNKNGYTLDPKTGNVYRVSKGRATYHSNLNKDLQRIFSQAFGSNGNVSLGLYDITNEMKWEINEKRKPSASVIKIYIAGAVYERFSSIAPSTEANLRAMMLYSDNNAANSLIALLGNGNYQRGFNEVNQYCARHGYKHTHLGRTLLGSNYYDDNYTSVGDCTQYMYDVYHNRIPGSQKLLNYLKNQYFRTKIPVGIPQGIVVGNKTGEVPGVENDVAIIYGAKRTYALSVMASGVTSSYHMQAAIQNASRYIYGYLN